MGWLTGVRARIIVAIIGAIVALVIGYWQFVHKPASSDEYAGRVQDARTEHVIRGAKVSVEAQGTQHVFYTDSEGMFYLKLRGAVDAVRIRIEATGYQPFDRNVHVSGTVVEDVRLTPSSGPLVLLPKYAWSQRTAVYHYDSCCWVNRISPENLQRGDIPPEGRRLHQGCPTKEINGRCGNETS